MRKIAHRDITILIVDSEPSMCWILSKILSDAGYRIKTAINGKEALRIFNHGTISLAILDYRLPDTDGITLFKELKAKDPNIFGILMTAYGSKTLREKALRSGFSFYFNKPINNQQLIDSVHRAVASLS